MTMMEFINSNSSSRDGNTSDLYNFTSSSTTFLIYETVVPEMVTRGSFVEYQKWVMSITACLLVGLSGIFPLLIFPHQQEEQNPNDNNPSAEDEDNRSDSIQNKSNNTRGQCGSVIPPATTTSADYDKSCGISSKKLKRLLNFSVGSLLGDVFLHLLPEAWNTARGSGADKHEALTFLGFWVLIGIISFVVCEKLVVFASTNCGDEDIDEDGGKKKPSSPANNNNEDKRTTQSASTSHHQVPTPTSNKQITGYLNLVANSFDNFTHGLAVAGSFVISCKIGVLTTAAILLHEIPHEIADFAILLRAGFNPWSAAKAQLSTATIGLLGAILTLSADSMQSMGNVTWWILPFTSGCFINIALTNLLPDLVKEDNPKEAVQQFLFILLGIFVMAFVSAFHEG